jgi:hypothetical protein
LREKQDHSGGAKIRGGNGGDREEGILALAHPCHTSSRKARRIDAIATTRDQQCAAFELCLPRYVGNGQGVTAGAKREAVDEGVFGLDRDGGSGMGEKLKPVPSSFAPHYSSDQTIGRNHRRVARQDQRLRRPHLHSARDEITICTTTYHGAGIEFGIRSRKIADLAKRFEVRLEKHLACAKRLEFDSHLSVFDYSATHTANTEAEVGGEVDGSVGEHRHRLDESAQP